MTAPDRIWAWVYADPWGNELRWFEWDDHKPDDGDTEYIRHDAAAIAASPVVQDLIRQAVEAEREACAKVAHDHGKPYARMFVMQKLARAGYQVTLRAKQRMCVRIAAAIRARGEG